MNKIKKIIKSILRLDQKNEPYDFDKNNPLGDGGERVDFTYTPSLDISKLDMYQQNHIQRYLFAEKTIGNNLECGDFACGTGYGSVILSKKSKSVLGIDLNFKVIEEIKKRYQNIGNVSFENKNLLEIDFENKFDAIISFETIEHFTEENIVVLLKLYHKALKNNGQIIFSVPYMQEESENAKKLGFHLTFEINEDKISNWLNQTGFIIEKNYYQNYKTHTIHQTLDDKEFIICIASKNA